MVMDWSMGVSKLRGARLCPRSRPIETANSLADQKRAVACDPLGALYIAA